MLVKLMMANKNPKIMSPIFGKNFTKRAWPAEARIQPTKHEIKMELDGINAL